LTQKSDKEIDNTGTTNRLPSRLLQGGLKSLNLQLCTLPRQLKFSATFLHIWYLGHPLTSR